MRDGRWLAVAVYAIGFFSLSLEPMFGLLIPLWALNLKASVLLVGIIVGGSAFLPSIFSIPMGALADRIGAKTLLLYAGAGTALCTALYPLWTNPWGLLALHMIVGSLQSLVWISAQAYVAKLGTDQQRSHLMGNFSSATTLGAFAGPLVVGSLLDGWGFSVTFFAASLWALMVTLMAFHLPPSGPGTPLAWSHLRPSLRDFQQAASLCAIPTVLFVIVGTFLRVSTYAIRGSYYPVYLKGIGFSAFSIGLLNSINNLVSSFSALCVGRLSQSIHAHHLLLFGLSLAIVTLALTPAFSSFRPLLLLTVLSGSGVGQTLPLLLSILANITGPEIRGLSAGLRTTANRLASLLVPIFLGLIIQNFGLATGFYLIGLLLMLAVGALFVYVQGSYLNASERK